MQQDAHAYDVLGWIRLIVAPPRCGSRICLPRRLSGEVEPDQLHGQPLTASRYQNRLR
jgi:hypothetical protein